MKTINKILAVCILTALAWALFSQAASCQDIKDRDSLNRADSNFLSTTSYTNYVMDIKHTHYIAHKTDDSSWVITDPDAIMDLNDYHVRLIDSMWTVRYNHTAKQLNALIRWVKSVADRSHDSDKLWKIYQKLQDESDHNR